MDDKNKEKELIKYEKELNSEKNPLRETKSSTIILEFFVKTISISLSHN